MLKKYILPFFSYLPGKELLKNSWTLIWGVALSQLTIFGFQIWIRRLYSPAIFGVYDVYLNVFSILVVIASFRYEYAIVNPKKIKTRVNVLAVSWLNITIFSVVLFFLLLIFNEHFAALINFPLSYSRWLYFLPVSVFLFSSYQAINIFFIREKYFRISSVNKINRRFWEGTMQSFLGVIQKPVGLIAGHIFSNAINLIVGIWQLIKRDFSIKQISLSKMKYVYKRYANFPKQSLIPHLLNTLSFSIPILYVNKFYGSESAGYLGLSRTVLAVPISLISASLSQVLLQKFSERRIKKLPLKSEISKLALFLLALIIPVTIILRLWSKELFVFIFSLKWTMAGALTQILVFSFSLQFIVTPLTSFFITYEKFKVQAVWQTMYFLLILSLYFFQTIDFISFVKIYLFIDLFSYFIYFIILYQQVLLADKKLHVS